MNRFFEWLERILGRQTSGVYVQIPVEFRHHLYHFKGAKLHTLMSILLYANKDRWAWPSYGLIAQDSGYSTDTIGKVLTELCGMSINGNRVLLRYQPHGEGGKFTSNRYLVFPNATEVAEYEGTGVRHLGAETGGGFDKHPSLEKLTTDNRGGKTRSVRGGKSPPQSNTIRSNTSNDDVVTLFITLVWMRW